MYKIQVQNEDREYVTLKSAPLTEEEAWEWAQAIERHTGELVAIVPADLLV